MLDERYQGFCPVELEEPAVRPVLVQTVETLGVSR
jgi:hypothetical protein